MTMPIGRRFLLVASATLIAGACVDAPTWPTGLDPRGGKAALHAGTTRHLSSQADCEALGGGLVGTWSQSSTSLLCTVTGVGQLTAEGDSLFIAVPVVNLGAVTSRGYVLIDTAPVLPAGTTFHFSMRPRWQNTGESALFVNHGVVSLRPRSTLSEVGTWEELGGRTDNFGRFELGAFRAQNARNFHNYGIFIHGGRLVTPSLGSFVNHCGAYYERGDFSIFGAANDYRVAEACPNLDSQNACEALDGGLTGEWVDEYACRITGVGELTAPGEVLVVSGWVEMLGVVTNRGKLVIGGYYRTGPPGYNCCLTTSDGYLEVRGVGARLVNTGAISIVTMSGIEVTGGAELENRGDIHILGSFSSLSLSGTTLHNYGRIISRGGVNASLVPPAALINHCGSTFESSGPEAQVYGNITTESPCAGTTPVGSNVPVTPVDATTGQPSDISIEFGSVTGAGVTTAATGVLGTAGAPPEPPATNFRLGDPATYFDISTTATFAGAATVCIDYSGISFGNVSELRLLHYEGGAWVDITSSVDTDETLVCGLTTSFSPFVIVEANQAPVITRVEVPADPRAVDTPVTISATFSDGNAGDSHTATIDWGDGSSSAATVLGGTIGGSHAYTTPGVYTVSVTVSDGGLSATRTSAVEMPAYIVVFDPTAGFVTGGGWIDSPAGACTSSSCAADGSTTGKATFGFVSRYKRGANVPDGNTEFQFVAGGLRFQSDSYDWLVVAGARAKFKGLGRIAGDARSFAFMLTATDGTLLGAGQADGFRIKIWDAATGTVIYDNQRGAADDADAVTALGGGSVVIHR